ncbi:hypothetical protein D3H65_02950 [Paraflavitalea soli]|uniref:Macroglobulin domain-containing protein n=1 Tax=Paraflavitalea soli TaxID=2315862 RepID=A0A3B7MF76_9BACT|nr:hypothetical protein [Paraflavitalea soli]AXY72988.1 hypothetical protein D3H65_02950 [Paraflavitalea soli]
MQKRLIRLFAFILLCLLARTANAQQQEMAVLDALDSSFSQYAAGRQTPDLFLHIDKNVYVRQENIWFTGYILGQDTATLQHTLYTLLVEEATKKIVLSDRFIIEAGIGAGTIFLPDSLPTGEYRLLAYTNSYLNHPQQSIFQQPISIRAGESTTFKLSMLPQATPATNTDSVYFTYKVLTGYGGLASGGDLAYTLQVEGKALQSGKKKINPFGEVSFAMLRQQVFGKRLQLQATISREKEKQEIKTVVPLFQDVAIIKLFPESGNLVHDHPSKTAIEIKNGQGVPIATRGQVLANGQPIAQFQTDQYGTGIINWLPQAGVNYTLQITDGSRPLVYQFPPVATTGYSLNLQQAVIKDTSFQIAIGTPGKSTCHLVAHNYRTAFFSGTFRTNQALATLRLSTIDMPEGVVTLTLFDSIGVPKAERAVYIQKGAPLRVQLTTDSTAYHHRAKLQLKVKVTNAAGQPVKSIFSLACVLASRLDSTRAADIVRFQHFDRYLPAPAAMPGTDYLSIGYNIEQILLTRYWTRYKWEEINTAPPYTAQEEKNCNVGYVYYKDRPVKKPVGLMIISGSKTFTLETDSSGYFELPSQALTVELGKKAIILVSDSRNFKDYGLKLHNVCSMLDTALSQVTWPVAGYSKAEQSVQEQEQEQQLLKKAMQAVVVTAKKYDNYFSGTFKSANCSDWVCMYNVLNCQNHPTGSMPVDGASYNYRGRMVVYEGCKGQEKPPGFMQQVNGTAYPKEFYVADYDKFNPTEPEVMSTLFWTYKVLTDEKGEATLQFSTNDLNGRFTCILQGYSMEGVISGKTNFRVTE